MQNRRKNRIILVTELYSEEERISVHKLSESILHSLRDESLQHPTN